MTLRYGCGYGHAYGNGKWDMAVLSAVCIIVWGLFTSGYSVCHTKAQCDSIVARTIRNVHKSYPAYNGATDCFNALVTENFRTNRVCPNGIPSETIMNCLVTCIHGNARSKRHDSVTFAAGIRMAKVFRMRGFARALRNNNNNLMLGKETRAIPNVSRTSGSIESIESIESHVSQVERIARAPVSVTNLKLTPGERQAAPGIGIKEDPTVCKVKSGCCTFDALDKFVNAQSCLQLNCTYWGWYLLRCKGYLPTDKEYGQ